MIGQERGGQMISVNIYLVGVRIELFAAPNDPQLTLYVYLLSHVDGDDEWGQPVTYPTGWSANSTQEELSQLLVDCALAYSKGRIK